MQRKKISEWSSHSYTQLKQLRKENSYSLGDEMKCDPGLEPPPIGLIIIFLLMFNLQISHPLELSLSHQITTVPHLPTTWPVQEVALHSHPPCPPLLLQRTAGLPTLERVSLQRECRQTILLHPSLLSVGLGSVVAGLALESGLQTVPVVVEELVLLERMVCR